MAAPPRDFDTLARLAQQALRDGTPLPSPCVGVCRIGDAGVCVGCARRLDEIGGWLHADEARRGAIWRRVLQRRGLQADAGSAAPDPARLAQGEQR